MSISAARTICAGLAVALLLGSDASGGEALQPETATTAEKQAMASACSLLGKICDSATKVTDHCVRPQNRLVELVRPDLEIPVLSRVPHLSRLLKIAEPPRPAGHIVVRISGKDSSTCCECPLETPARSTAAAARQSCQDCTAEGCGCKKPIPSARLAATAADVFAAPFATPFAASCGQCKSATQSMDEQAHLMAAAKHLLAAGKKQLSAQVRREALLSAKLKQLAKLEAEIAELRPAPAEPQTVTLQVKIMELDVAKMRRLGLDFQTLRRGQSLHVEGQNVLLISKSRQALDGMLTALQENDLLKVIAEPTLVTVSGRPASIRTGGEFPVLVPQGGGEVAVEYRSFGTQLDCLPKVLKNGKIRLELRPTISEIDPSRTVVVEGQSIPGLRSRMLDAAVEMTAGQTVVLGELFQERSEVAPATDSHKETALVVAVTASLRQPAAATAARPASQKR